MLTVVICFEWTKELLLLVLQESRPPSLDRVELSLTRALAPSACKDFLSA